MSVPWKRSPPSTSSTPPGFSCAEQLEVAGERRGAAVANGAVGKLLFLRHHPAVHVVGADEGEMHDAVGVGPQAVLGRATGEHRRGDEEEEGSEERGHGRGHVSHFVLRRAKRLSQSRNAIAGRTAADGAPVQQPWRRRFFATAGAFRPAASFHRRSWFQPPHHAAACHSSARRASAACTTATGRVGSGRCRRARASCAQSTSTRLPASIGHRRRCASTPLGQRTPPSRRPASSSRGLVERRRASRCRRTRLTRHRGVNHLELEQRGAVIGPDDTNPIVGRAEQHRAAVTLWVEGEG
jgi:hypothetical protein